MHSRLARCASALAVAIGLAACGDNLKPRTDDGLDATVDVAIDAVPAVCGNGRLEAGEDCDDGDDIADAVCGATCRFTCGNGLVDAVFGELCDTAIASGAGACPASCDDGQACTADVATGSGCQAGCEHAPITATVGGDGCCPTDATSVTDSDCPVVCGNGEVETGELCDTGIRTGAGACPTACSDGMSCTADAVVGVGCSAACAFTPITVPNNGDGCCPPGTLPADDTDCVLGCGNGRVDPGETCDIAITIGPGRCPTVCNDGMTCTRDVLSNAGTCTAACSFPAITTMTAGDGCCLPGGNNTTDSDCAPRCGNAVIETGEQCDDGNTINTDACSNTCTLTTVAPTAFRMSDLDLRDPHTFASVFGFCSDITANVNTQIQTAVQTDGDADTFLDLSIATVFRPLNQTAAAVTPLEIHFPRCTTPLATTTCSRTPSSGMMVTTTGTSQTAGTCLGLITGTTRATYGTIALPTGPCYVSGTTSVQVSLGGILLTLQDAQIGATYVGNPATGTVNGLLRGFVTEADAIRTILPASLPLVGGQTLASLLPGGMGNCSRNDDRDMNGTVRGWWFYLSFTAPRATWIDN